MTLDLVVLVPDKAIEQAIKGLLQRHPSIGIRALSGVELVVHPGRDPGVFNTGAALLEPFVGGADHALIVFDRVWEGAPSNDAAELAAQVEQACRTAWGDRAKCVCIDPEIENWVWSDSPHVANALGWRSRRDLIAWLSEGGLWPRDLAKPPDPKAAFRAATRHANVPPSASIFGELARQVSIKRCHDPAFLRLLEILRAWFPLAAGSGHQP